MVNPKISSYLGFAIKAGKVTMGFNAVETLKKEVYLLIVCHSASDNSKKQAVKLQRKFSVPLLECKGDTLENVIKKPLCKFVAVRDKNFAEVILKQQDENFGIYAGGNN